MWRPVSFHPICKTSMTTSPNQVEHLIWHDQHVATILRRGQARPLPRDCRDGALLEAHRTGQAGERRSSVANAPGRGHTALHRKSRGLGLSPFGVVHPRRRNGGGHRNPCDAVLLPAPGPGLESRQAEVWLARAQIDHTPWSVRVVLRARRETLRDGSGSTERILLIHPGINLFAPKAIAKQPEPLRPGRDPLRGRVRPVRCLTPNH